MNLSLLKITSIVSALTALLVGCATNSNNDVQAIEKIQALSSQKDCAGAEQYARSQFGDGDLMVVLGAIEIDCKNNRRGGIEYWKSAAREGNQKAIQALISLGETPPEPTRQVIIQQQPQAQQQQVPDLSERLRRATEAVQQGPWGYRGGGGGAVTGSGLTCFKAREWISGSLKNCAYNCNGSEAVQTVSASSLCPMSMTR